MNVQGDSPERGGSAKRPRIVTFLGLCVLMYTVLSWTRFAETLGSGPFLEALPLTVSPVYLQATGLLFGVSGLIVAWGLWRGEGWAPGATKIFALAAAGVEWLDRLVFAVREIALANWPFALALTLATLAFVFAVLITDEAEAFFKTS